MKVAKTKDPETHKSVPDKTTVIYNPRITLRYIPLQHPPSTSTTRRSAGEIAHTVFSKRDQIPAEITQRVIIPNDTKMFAQADVTPAITHYLTADQKCEVVYRLAQGNAPMRFQILSLRTPHHLAFGELNLDD
jgi:hypothetical protein